MHHTKVELIMAFQFSETLGSLGAFDPCKLGVRGPITFVDSHTYVRSKYYDLGSTMPENFVRSYPLPTLPWTISSARGEERGSLHTLLFVAQHSNEKGPHKPTRHLLITKESSQWYFGPISDTCIQCEIYIRKEELGALIGQVSPLWKRTWIQSPLTLENL